MAPSQHVDVPARPPRRVPIAARFWLVLGALVAAMLVMGGLGFDGLARMADSAGGLQAAAAETKRDTVTRAHLVDLRSALQLYVATDDTDVARRTRQAVEASIARLDLALDQQRRDADHADDVHITVLERRGLDRLVAAWRSGAVDAGRVDSSHRAATIALAERLVAPLITLADELSRHNVEVVDGAGDAAAARYRATRTRMAIAFSFTLVLGAGLVLWLIRTIVPRARRYSTFAAEVSSGRLGGRLAARGTDELAELGRSLDDLVVRHEGEREYQGSQAEFVDAMQVTATEDEAHDLIRRHLERSIARSKVVVLNRNNSDDRLESRTAVEPGSPLAEGLDGATPRSCLAVRFGRRHEDGRDRDALLSCEVCGKTPELATCNPLLVGGEVIGSVLINHDEELGDRDEVRIRDSVSQAAPVLANLRNLAIAELRASTDVLTGLPNNRAVQDTLKRMVAQAARSGAPLSAALLDLDHFKQINDTYGHDRGDEVLAAVAEAMRASVRASDFVGRYGGEEFLLLFPDTDLEGAAIAAETIRAAVAKVTLPTVDREITASIGLAAMPNDGLDGETLVRAADRCLYVAKSNGRNRVETPRGKPDAAVA